MMIRLIYILLFLFSIVVFGQKKDGLPNFKDSYHLVKTGDTLTIELDEISIFPKHKFKSRTDRNYYYWFRKKVHKAYPFARLASKRLDSLNVRLLKIKSRRKRRKYTRLVQEYVEEQFTSQLKKLTRTEGRILIKLLHRQTGETSYEIIGDLRSGFKAFIYNAQAGLFSLSLKEEYKPETVNEDYLIEDVLQRSFMDGSLEEQKSKLAFKASKLIASKKGSIDVEKYKAMFAKQRKRKKK